MERRRRPSAEEFLSLVTRWAAEAGEWRGTASDLELALDMAASLYEREFVLPERPGHLITKLRRFEGDLSRRGVAFEIGRGGPRKGAMRGTITVTHTPQNVR